MLLATLIACAPPPPGIVIVSIDTLRADRLGAWGNSRGLTPNLDHLAAESIVFERAFAQANETLYSHASLFTSRYPSELGPLTSQFTIPSATPTLAGVLHAYGWQTAAFVAGGHLGKDYGFDRGFDSYDDSADWGSLRDTVPPALRWIDDHADKPFFTFVHGYDTHDRYVKPTPFGYAFADPAYAGAAAALVQATLGTSQVVSGVRVPLSSSLQLLARSRPRFEGGRGIEATAGALRLTDTDTRHIRDVYDGAVAYADFQFGALMAGLERQGLLDTTTILVLSDHGEGLGEDGTFNHRFHLTDETLHVPLLLRPAGGTEPRRVTDLVELTDVLPTILALAGALPPAGIRGRSLLGQAPPRTEVFSESALRQVSVRGAGTRLVVEGLTPGNPLLPGLLATLPLDGVALRVSGDPAAAPSLRDALVAWRTQTNAHLGAPGPARSTTEAIQRHGYWEATP